MRTTFKVKRKEIKVATSWTPPVVHDSEANENAMPCLKRKANTSSKKINKKGSFYFELPFE